LSPSSRGPGSEDSTQGSFPTTARPRGRGKGIKPRVESAPRRLPPVHPTRVGKTVSVVASCASKRASYVVWPTTHGDFAGTARPSSGCCPFIAIDRSSHRITTGCRFRPLQGGGTGHRRRQALCRRVFGTTSGDWSSSSIAFTVSTRALQGGSFSVFSLPPALPAGCCPLGLSAPGKLLGPRISLQVLPGCTGDTRSTVTAHSGPRTLPSRPVIGPLAPRPRRWQVLAGFVSIVGPCWPSQLPIPPLFQRKQ
jgi:hypothetical protein